MRCWCRRFGKIAGEVILGEDASWERFEDFVRNRQASVAQFDASCEMLASLAVKGNSTPSENATSLA